MYMYRQSADTFVKVKFIFVNRKKESKNKIIKAVNHNYLLFSFLFQTVSRKRLWVKQRVSAQYDLRIKAIRISVAKVTVNSSKKRILPLTIILDRLERI